MTINSQVLYDNFTYDHKQVYSEINKTNAQISSGKKIQHAYENGAIFTKSLRLDSEVKNLEKIKDRTTSAKVYADNADSIMTEFDLTLRDFKTKLINASNETLNEDNYEALATELEGLKEHMKDLANTSVNGIHLFSGTNTNISPIDNEGNYLGNEQPLKIIISNDIDISYSIDGQTLFLGEENKNKVVSTNVNLKNYNTNENIQANDTIESLIENSTGDDINIFISGTKHDGTNFKTKISLDTNNTMEDLLIKVGEEFGNTNDTKVVDVTLDDGKIVVSDLQNGKSSLNLNMVGFQGGNSDNETDLTNVTYDNVIKFTHSNFNSPLGVDEDRQMNSFYFEKSGSTLTGNNPILANGEYADNTTLLSDIANGSLDGATYKMSLTDIAGNSVDVDLNLDDTSTFTINGTDYNIYNADGTQTKADEMTQGQLNNIISMVISGELPQTNDKAGFDTATIEARKKVEVKLDSSNRLQIKDKTADGESKIQFSLYDSKANDFSASQTSNPSPTINYMSNNLVTVQKPQMDFFKDLDEIIESVRAGKVSIDSNKGDPRNIGIQNSLGTLDKFLTHFNKEQSNLGSLSKALESENQKATTLQVNVETLKSEIEDVDLAETITKLNQLTLNYQAMLSTISKVNSLSLLNYLK